eukprot:CAMPEP_0203813140 /NCGR_PEP_ID=MMETSP0115-20131106/4548_1 /ASSEMBLY_ACC=CAM_ASM_000227 /TAXON_ID=33651 /ORGANISM="Bicosoecid sp, Strain ms1" /LENGTH=290 /DNA_ID=CAMNT_0050721999 /DNA_START=35 /DNA_END=907 /DNA_ORIENTATION=+
MAMNWGDEVDGEVGAEFIPPPKVTGPDEDGVMTRVEYKIRPDGKRVKVTKRIRRIRRVFKITETMKARKEWKKRKFGLAADSADDGNVTFVGDDVKLEKPDDEELEGNAMLKKVVEALAKAKARGTNNFWAEKAAQFGGDEGGGDEGGDGSTYRPPGARGGSGGGGGGASRFGDRDDSNTLRVTNLSADTMEADLFDLFRPFGHVERVYLAKDRETRESRGFAFVSFGTKADAERARGKLNGYGYDHLILGVDWAKPSKPKEDSGGGGGGGLGGNKFVSGYGKALPQGKA